MKANNSVIDLVNDLIHNVCTDTNPDQPNLFKTNPKLLKNCKRKSHEILLHKSASNQQLKYLENVQTDPIEELFFCHFEMKTQADGNPEEMERCTEFEDCLKDIVSNHFYSEDLGKSLLTLLLALKSSKKIAQTSFKDFSLDHPTYTKLKPYSLIPLNQMQMPNFFTQIYEGQCLGRRQNPYLSEQITKIKSNGENGSTTLNPFTSIIQDLCTNLNLESIEHQNEIDEQQYGPSIEMIEEITNKSTDSLNSYLYNCNWENLGKCSNPEVAFASETNSLLHLVSITTASSQQMEYFTAKIVSTRQFINDTKSLMVGIRSDSYTLNENNTSFFMHPKLTIQNISSSTISGIISEFIDCGTCFYRLYRMVNKQPNSSMLKNEGFVYKALCLSIQSYLCMFRRFVMWTEDTSLMQLLKRTESIVKQLKALAHFVLVYPKENSSKLPRGSELLSYVYRATIDITQKDLSCVFASILQQCCHVYFKNFEKWIFHGYIDDACKELFVDFVDHYRSNTKYFWDKAYVLKRQSVPVFLQGFEDTILQCGKYTMLLKVCKPTHPMLTYPPPDIEVCLSFSQIEKMRQRCTNYVKLAQQLCGKPITIVEIFHRHAHRKNEFKKAVAAKLKENHEKWMAQQQQNAEQNKLQKERNLAILQHEIALIHERKIQQRLKNIEEDRKYLEAAQDVEDKLIMKENQQRQKNIEYYQELEKLIDDRRQKMKHQINDLKHQIELEKEMPNLMLAKSSADSMASEYTTARETVDEDASSIYHSTGKLSDDFIEKFGKSEQILTAIVDRKEIADDLTVVNENFKISETKNIENDLLNSNSIATIVARNKNLTSQLIFVDDNDEQGTEKGTGESHSEPVTARDSNLNEIPSASMTEWQKNKRKNLNSELDAVIRSASATDFRNLNRENPPPLTDLEKNRQHVMQVEFGSTISSSKSVQQMKIDNGNTESDLVKNRRKIMQSEFDLRVEEQKPIVRNDNALTDLEKNRNKVLHGDFGFGQSDYKESQAILRSKCQSELERNREKVLREEFGYDVKQRTMNLDLNLLSTPRQVVPFAGTPMSIGSDTPICEHNIDFDIHDANVNPLPPPLKLDINLANSKTNDYKDALDSCPIPTASSAPISTPIHEKCEQQLQPIQERHPILESSLTEKSNRDVQRFFRMPIRQNTDTQLCFEKFETDLTDLQSLNVTTVTQFLQTSFVIPMQAYLTVLSNEVLKMYIKDQNIMGHFKSLRNYFFLLDGEFGSYICDKLISRLESNAKPSELLNFNALHTILENALGSSVIANDINASNLSFIIDEIPDKFDLASPNVIKMLSLSYMIQWPLNLLLNPETISHYAKIFKYLLKIRRISWLLDRSFQTLKEVAKYSQQKIQLSPQYRRIQQIRHKLLNFVNALQNHLTANALQSSWKHFCSDLETAKSMEDLYQKHIKYLKRVEFLCMLNKSSLDYYMKLEDVFVIVLRFYYKLKSRNWRLQSETYIHPNFDKLLIVEQDFQKLIKYIIHAGAKMSRRGYQTEIGEFISLININGYYDNNE